MTDQTQDTQAATSGTVEDLKAHLDTIETPEQLAELRKAEEDGKARTTALAAIDAKASDLTTDNVTKAPADDAAKNDPNAEGDGEKPVTVLAEVEHPEDLTDEDIADIAGGDKDGPQAYVTAALEQLRDEANGEEVERPYQHGMGPGADIG